MLTRKGCASLEDDERAAPHSASSEKRASLERKRDRECDEVVVAMEVALEVEPREHQQRVRRDAAGRKHDTRLVPFEGSYSKTLESHHRRQSERSSAAARASSGP